jgi:rhodanese-related sulfurtransferase
MTNGHEIVRGLGTAAAVLGALAFVVGAPVRSERAASVAMVSAATRDALDGAPAEPTVHHLSALQLAEWIRDGKPGLRVLDLRDAPAFERRHIPSAESFALTGLSTVLPRPDETVVVYSDDDLRDVQGVAWLVGLGHRRLHVVQGGMSAWMAEVIDPVVQGDSATSIAALSRYFGGVPRAATPSDDARDPRATRATPAARVRIAGDEYRIVTRRGC